MLESKPFFGHQGENRRMMVLIEKTDSYQFTGSVINELFVLTVPNHVDDINAGPALYNVYFRYKHGYPDGSDGYRMVGVEKAFKNEYYPFEDCSSSNPEPPTFPNAGLIKVSLFHICKSKGKCGITAYVPITPFLN